MPYHIDEENSELVFGVHDGDKLVISLKPGAGSGSGGCDIYIIKSGDNTEPAESNVFSARTRKTRQTISLSFWVVLSLLS